MAVFESVLRRLRCGAWGDGGACWNVSFLYRRNRLFCDAFWDLRDGPDVLLEHRVFDGVVDL